MRWLNCTVSVFSNRLRHAGVSNHSRSADGMNAPSIDGQVLKLKPASRPATSAPR